MVPVAPGRPMVPVAPGAPIVPAGPLDGQPQSSSASTEERIINGYPPADASVNRRVEASINSSGDHLDITVSSNQYRHAKKGEV
jgi:hypothetical protein